MGEGEVSNESQPSGRWLSDGRRRLLFGAWILGGMALLAFTGWIVYGSVMAAIAVAVFARELVLRRWDREVAERESGRVPEPGER